MRLVLHEARQADVQDQRSESDGEKQNLKNPLTPLSPFTAKTCSPSAEGITKKTSSLPSPPRFGLAGSSFLFSFSWIVPPLRLGPSLVGLPSRTRQLLARAGWLSDTATLTELYHVTALLAEHLT